MYKKVAYVDKIYALNFSLSAQNSVKKQSTTVKKRANLDIKLFLSCTVLLDISILFQIFCPEL